MSKTRKSAIDKDAGASAAMKLLQLSLIAVLALALTAVVMAQESTAPQAAAAPAPAQATVAPEAAAAAPAPVQQSAGVEATATPAETEKSAAPDKIGYGAAFPVLSAYVWRGAVVTDEPVIQPEAWIQYKGLKLDLWNNVDLTDDRVEAGQLNETDWTLSYTLPISSPAISVGYIYYTFPNLHIPDTQEAFASASFPVFLSPAIAVYYDFDQVGGAYANGSVSYDVEIVKPAEGDPVKAVLGASVGYGDAGYISGCFADVGASPVDLVLSCKVPLKLSEHVSLTPQISYMQVLDDDLRECTGTSDILYGGVALTVEF